MCFLHKTTGFYLVNTGTELMENRTRRVYKYASTSECQAQVTDLLLALQLYNVSPNALPFRLLNLLF